MPGKKFTCLAAADTSVILTLASLHRPESAAVLSRTGFWVVESISPAPRGFAIKAAASHPHPWRGSSIPKLPIARGDWEIRRRDGAAPRAFQTSPVLEYRLWHSPVPWHVPFYDHGDSEVLFSSRPRQYTSVRASTHVCPQETLAFLTSFHYLSPRRKDHGWREWLVDGGEGRDLRGGREELDKKNQLLSVTFPCLTARARDLGYNLLNRNHQPGRAGAASWTEFPLPTQVFTSTSELFCRTRRSLSWTWLHERLPKTQYNL